MTPSNLQLQTAKTPRATSVVLRSACPAMEERHTRNARNPLPDFCKGLSVGENTIVRVSNSEKEDSPDEEYFVAKIKEKAIKLEESGTYSTIPGDRFFKKELAQWIPCGSIIRSLKECLVM